MLPEILVTTILLTAIIAARYVAVAGSAFWLLWRRRMQGQGRPGRAIRLNRHPPTRAQIRHELAASLIASPIYAFPAAVAFALWRRGGTAIYTDVDRYGWLWLAISAAIYLALQDTYYYWLHRAMHHPRVYRWTHAGHHVSREPTPFASFSFDAAESALTAWFLPALTLFIPIHVGVILALLTLMTVSAVLNHSGWEVMPRWWRDGAPGWLMIGASHHALHHTRFACNYGLYFRLWDRVMGTDRPPSASGSRASGGRASGGGASGSGAPVAPAAAIL
jgi:sterol desaturase/sphingolipid hydroxylase (fatty acid hydroxylase superfamily)